ncbi:MAG: hypothetical protein GX139_12330 [Armatimonadetes bacterium]|jgi:fucose permease|nr:hypothetical protein [Armatimonadota bacterium]
MLRTLNAMAVGLVVAITMIFLLPRPMVYWKDYLGVAVGAAIAGLMLRSRQWLFGALVGVMYGGFMAACISWVFASFKRSCGIQLNYHDYLVVAAHTLGCAIVGAAAAEAAPKVRSMLRR